MKVADPAVWTLLALMSLWSPVESFATSVESQEALSRFYREAQEAERRGDHLVAIDRYQRIINIAPTMAEAHAKLGGVFFQIGEVEKASNAFKTAVRLKPTLSGAHFSLGVIAF